MAGRLTDLHVAMLPSDVPAWMIVVLITILTANEVVWYSLVSLFFGSSPVRRFYVIANDGSIGPRELSRISRPAPALAGARCRVRPRRRKPAPPQDEWPRYGHGADDARV